MSAFPVPMRVTPTTTVFNPFANNNQVRNLTTGTDCTASSITSTDQYWRMEFTTAVGSGVGHLLTANAQFNAEI